LDVNAPGVIPYYKELPCFSVNYLADRLFAKIIAGENNLNGIVENVFIGSVSASAVSKDPLKDDTEKICLIEKMISDHVDLKNFIWQNNSSRNKKTNGFKLRARNII